MSSIEQSAKKLCELGVLGGEKYGLEISPVTVPKCVFEHPAHNALWLSRSIKKVNWALKEVPQSLVQ